MAILDISKREPSSPSTPNRAKKSLFSFTKTNSSLSSFSSHLPPPTPTHTFSLSIMEENIDNAEQIIMKWDPKGSSFEKFKSLFQESRREAKEFVKMVRELRRAMHYLVEERSGSDKLVLAQNLMQIAMKRLENEMYQILSTNREHLDPESVSKSSRSSHLSRSLSVNSRDDGEEENETGSDDEIRAAGETITEVERRSILAMSDLKMIADCMVSSGYAKECVKIYRIFRNSIVDEGLYRLGIERQSSTQINRLSSDALDNQIKNWIDASKIAVKTLFQGERFLCDHVFSTSNTIRETCFTDIAKEGGLLLFKFPEIVAKNKKSPDKIFQLMDLHDSISELWPEIESIFSYESVSGVKLQALSSLHKLSDSVRTILSEFELSIQKNSSRSIVPGGGIHPLTNSVLDFVSSLANYSGVLSDIIGDSSTASQSPFPESYYESPTSNETTTSALSTKLAWIILVLLCKLDTKSKLYNDIALSYLFLANNLQFIVEKVRTSALKCLLGDDWVSNLERKVKLYAANYENMAWTKVFQCLPESYDPSISPERVKEHFRQYNTSFEDAYKKQRSWVVPDAKLRDDIKVSISRKLVLYRDFYDAYMVVLSGENNLEVLVRYSPDNLGNYLSDLFHATTTSGSYSPSSSYSSSHYRLARCLP